MKPVNVNVEGAKVRGFDSEVVLLIWDDEDIKRPSSM